MSSTHGRLEMQAVWAIASGDAPRSDRIERKFLMGSLPQRLVESQELHGVVQGAASSASVSKLTVAERSFSSLRQEEWDDFAVASGGSFLGSWRVINARRLLGRVKLFDFLLPDGARGPRKVGQCAVQVRNGKVTFLDKIQLAAAQQHLSRRCLDLVVRQFGGVAYAYGSQWNDEDGFDLGGIQQFDIGSRTFHLDLIDCGRWADFAAYRRGVSENIRRDYKKAKDAGTVVKTSVGLAAMCDLFALVAMRGHMMRRNKRRFSHVFDYFLHAAKLLVLGQRGFIITGKIKGRCYAAFFGAEVGDRLYYISGGTRNSRLGVGSYLFLTLIERWFSKYPTGKLLMGDCGTACDHPIHNCGNLLYRRKLRVRSVNGVNFHLKPKPAGGNGNFTAANEHP
jgi:hypothetical protein